MNSLSIISTYYKGENFIFNCIDSLVNSYERSKKKMNYEIVLIIDSIDDSDHIFNLLSGKYTSIPIRIIKNVKNIGVSASRNVGLDLIKYDFYTIIDQDDYVTQEYFSALEQELDENYAVHMINGSILNITENISVPIYYFTPDFDFNNLILKNTVIYTPALLIFNKKFVPSKELFIDASEKYKGCDDWAAYLNILVDFELNVKMKFINKLLFVYCMHAENFSNNKGTMINSSIAVLNYLNKKNNLKETYRAKVNLALSRQAFYLDKEVNNFNKGRLFLTYPAHFASHYLLSFFNKQRLNRLIFRIKYLKIHLLGS